MKYLDEYRDAAAAHKLIDEIKRTATQKWTLMEVCGGQTHSLLRYGIEVALEGVVELIHGPGCPVCVTPTHAIEFAQELSLRDDVLLTTFGDMMRVPAPRTLNEVKARGGNVRNVYSPLDAVRLANEDSKRHVVFFAVGFETTAPATALAVKQAQHDRLQNFSLLVAHVRVQPAMEQLACDPATRIQGFLAAGHVCTVMGFDSYESFVEEFRLPVVVAGFEPLDLLSGILACVRQLERAEYRVQNEYGRSVRPAGNEAAQRLIAEVYEVTDSEWRGFGPIARGGYRLRTAFENYDAAHRFVEVCPIADGPKQSCDNACRSVEVLAGQLKPNECEAFGTTCTPDSPLGAPMVSSEGTCAAFFQYRRTL